MNKKTFSKEEKTEMAKRILQEAFAATDDESNYVSITISPYCYSISNGTHNFQLIEPICLSEDDPVLMEVGRLLNRKSKDILECINKIPHFLPGFQKKP